MIGSRSLEYYFSKQVTVKKKYPGAQVVWSTHTVTAPGMHARLVMDISGRSDSFLDWGILRYSFKRQNIYRTKNEIIGNV